MAQGKPPDKSDQPDEQDGAAASTHVQAEPNRVASNAGNDEHGNSTETPGDGHGEGEGSAENAAGTNQRRRFGRDPAAARLRLRLDAQGTGASTSREPERRASDREGDESAGAEEAATPAAVAVQVAPGVRLHAQCLEDPEAGPEASRHHCYSFSLGDEPFAYVANWLTDYCWREGSSKEIRQSRSNRRKTLLFFNEPTKELVGFAAWRMREEQISGTMQIVGEVRFLAVIPDYRGRGVASQMWSTVKSAIMTSDQGSGDRVIRIEVDHANTKAREVYEHGWGFEYAYSHVSGGRPYDVLLYRPERALDTTTPQSVA